MHARTRLLKQVKDEEGMTAMTAVAFLPNDGRVDLDVTREAIMDTIGGRVGRLITTNAPLAVADDQETGQGNTKVATIAVYHPDPSVMQALVAQPINVMGTNLTFMSKAEAVAASTARMGVQVRASIRCYSPSPNPPFIPLTPALPNHRTYPN